MDDYEGHEKAEIYNLLGYVYYSLDNIEEGLRQYQRIIDEPEANAPLVTRTRKTIASLYASVEDYPSALKHMLDWMSTQEIIGANDYVFVGQLYFAMEDLPNALTNIEIAISQREERGELGQESWYGIQRSIYYEQENYPKVVEIMKTLITHFPNVRYWRELGSMYAELEDRDKQMAAFDVAYLQDGLETEGQLLALAYMYIGEEAPARAEKIIREGMDDGVIEKSAKNMELLGNTIYQSRDVVGALPVMEEAAKLAETGEIYSRLANIYLDLERFGDAENAAREAIRRGGIRRPDIIQIVLGNALFEQQKYDEAIRAFRDVKDERTEESARQWVVYAERERRFRQELAAAGVIL